MPPAIIRCSYTHPTKEIAVKSTARTSEVPGPNFYIQNVTKIAENL